ncbi:S1C family serine protease [Frankia sp. Cr1]|uniref:S1C family serine protease n=1 Tax=Frankia sp. Cr1 TaxID=3073931 RepID=UPI002AD3B594|nr:trypsin-like peptidase domain-containing protein [Frankia sp. Cr1]
MVGEERPGTSAWRLRAAALGCVTACMTSSAVAIGTGTPASGMAGGLLDATIVPGPAIRTFAAPGLVTAATGSPIPSQRSGVADRVTPGVVRIVSTLASQSGSAAGTGMVLNSAGEVLTNNHVIQDAASITVTVASTGRAYPAAVVGADATNDVAVLQLRGAAGLTTVPIGDSAKISIGASVAAVGNAEGGAPTVVTGAVTALNQSITATDPGGGNAEQLTGLIRTNLAIKPGFSGGPLVSAAGQVVGMDTAATMFNEYLPAGMRAGYSIPINHAIAVAHQLEAAKPAGTAGTAGTAGGDDGRGAAAGTATGTATAARPGSPAARVVMTTAARRTGDVQNEGEDGADGRRNAPVAPVAPVRAILPQVGQRPARPSRRRPGRQSGSSQPRG